MNQAIRFTRGGGGVRIAYAESGSGPPLVKAANWLSHLEFDWQSPVWRHWFQFLSSGDRLIRYDARGCGLSDWEVEDLSLEAQVADLDAVIHAAGVSRFPLIGISQGGAIAVEYTLCHPERLTQLVIYGAAVRGRNRRDLESARQHEALNVLVRSGWGRDNPAFRRLFTALFIPDATDEQERWFSDLMRVTSRPDIAARIREASANVDVSGKLAAVRVPTLVMHARDDACVPFAEGRTFAAGIPGARFVSLESRNHILLDFEPAWQRFCAEFGEFIGRDARASSATTATARLAQLTERERAIPHASHARPQQRRHRQARLHQREDRAESPREHLQQARRRFTRQGHRARPRERARSLARPRGIGGRDNRPAPQPEN